MFELKWISINIDILHPVGFVWLPVTAGHVKIHVILKYSRLECVSYCTLSTTEVRFLYSSMTHNRANDIILAIIVVHLEFSSWECISNAIRLLANIFAIKAFLVVKSGQKVSKIHRALSALFKLDIKIGKNYTKITINGLFSTKSDH